MHKELHPQKKTLRLVIKAPKKTSPLTPISITYDKQRACMNIYITMKRTPVNNEEAVKWVYKNVKIRSKTRTSQTWTKVSNNTRKRHKQPKSYKASSSTPQWSRQVVRDVPDRPHSWTVGTNARRRCTRLVFDWWVQTCHRSWCRLRVDPDPTKESRNCS